LKQIGLFTLVKQTGFDPSMYKMIWSNLQ